MYMPEVVEVVAEVAVLAEEVLAVVVLAVAVPTVVPTVVALLVVVLLVVAVAQCDILAIQGVNILRHIIEILCETPRFKTMVIILLETGPW